MFTQQKKSNPVDLELDLIISVRESNAHPTEANLATLAIL